MIYLNNKKGGLNVTKPPFSLFVFLCASIPFQLPTHTLVIRAAVISLLFSDTP